MAYFRGFVANVSFAEPLAPIVVGSLDRRIAGAARRNRLSGTPEADVHDTVLPAPVPRPKRSPLTIIAVSVVALLVLGGAAFAAVTIIGQQQQLSHLDQVVRLHTRALKVMSAKILCAQLCGRQWVRVLSRSQTQVPPPRISNRRRPPLIPPPRRFLRLTSRTGPTSMESGVRTTRAAALSDPPCTMPEDVTRDRLYVRQDCAIPFYRG